jgi:septum formation protein
MCQSILKLPIENLKLILASASPRRAELLAAAGIPFDVHPAHVDERVLDGESPDGYVRRIAEAKARTVSERFPRRLVLGADTTVVVDDLILAKPESELDARRMLAALSGRTHDVLTGVSIAGRAFIETAISRTSVEFAVLSADEIAEYVASGEPMDKAGAYGIQGLASRFVTRIDGSYSNVVGLPVALVYDMLKRVGAREIP